MIKGLSAGKYLTVTNGMSSDPYISPGAVGAGMMRYNSNMNCIEVSDGVAWKQIGMSYATVDLDYSAQQIMDWAKQKMEEEQKLDELCKKYPGLERARSNFETFKRLVLEEDASDTQVQSSP
jgi:hypothetical protein